MCEFLSLDVDKEGNVYALLGDERDRAILNNENPDSHTYISHMYNLDDDNIWKYELPIQSLDDFDIFENSDALMGAIKYDGGLPEEEVPYSVVKGMCDWLRTHKNDIMSAFTHKDIESRLYEIYHLAVENEGGGIVSFENDIPLLKFFLKKARVEKNKVTLDGVTLYYDRKDVDAKSFRWYLKYKVHEYAVMNENGEPEKRVEPRLIINPVLWDARIE